VPKKKYRNKYSSQLTEYIDGDPVSYAWHA